MIIINNPPFHFLKNKKQKYALKNIYENADDFVVLATWRFCNNVLEKQELVMPHEWKVIPIAMGISSKNMKYNKEEKPEFYLKKSTEYDEETAKNYVYFRQSDSFINATRPGGYRKPKYVEITKDLYIRASGNNFSKKGTKKEFIYVYPKKDYEKYKEQIFIDTLKWVNMVNKYALVRKEFCE